MENEDQKIIINDKEYNVNDLSQQSITLINYVGSIDKKLKDMQVEIDQMNAARYRFLELLTQSLETNE